MTSGGVRRPDTLFLLKSKKFQLKKLSTRWSLFYFYLMYYNKNILFSEKFKICLDSVGWQGWWAVHKLQKTTPTESNSFLKILEFYKLNYEEKLL